MINYSIGVNSDFTVFKPLRVPQKTLGKLANLCFRAMTCVKQQSKGFEDAFWLILFNWRVPICLLSWSKLFLTSLDFREKHS